MRIIKPTEIQWLYLKYISSCIKKNSRPPSIRELCTKFGLKSTNAPRTHIKELIQKGFLRKDEMIARGLSITTKGRRIIRNLAIREMK